MEVQFSIRKVLSVFSTIWKSNVAAAAGAAATAALAAAVLVLKAPKKN